MQGEFHLNLTVDQLTPSDQKREIWFFPVENDIDFTHLDHVAGEGEIKICTLADIQKAYAEVKGRHDLTTWLASQHKQHPGEKTLLVTLTVDGYQVSYTFSPEFR